jgi:hypothetical protein
MEIVLAFLNQNAVIRLNRLKKSQKTWGRIFCVLAKGQTQYFLNQSQSRVSGRCKVI